MEKSTLVIMAAGLGSRFGAGKGQKQVTPVDDEGHLIIDYSIYDAIRAGFEKVVFVVKPETEKQFHDAIGSRVSPFIEVAYAHQTLDRFVPAGFAVPEGREKPWGTGHAALCARDCVPGPFVVINADDFYGADAYRAAMEFMKTPHEDNEHAMVGYRLRNTMTPFGSVARGVCETGEDGNLLKVIERTKIVPRGNDAVYLDDGGETPLSGDATVSLNFWIFQKAIFEEMQNRFERFLRDGLASNPLKNEYYLPAIPNQLLAEDAAKVSVLTTNAKWFGMTYLDDLPNTKENIARMKAEGRYPQKLWERG